MTLTQTILDNHGNAESHKMESLRRQRHETLYKYWLVPRSTL